MKFFRRQPSTPGHSQPLPLVSIGYVRNGVEQPGARGWDTVVSEIVINEEYAAGLTGLAGFERITVLCWMDRVPEGARKAVALGPGWSPGMPALGVFATRTQFRPNPLLVSTVELLKVEGNVLHVRGLDALDNTPVLDLRPYLPPYDAFPDSGMPTWVWGANGKSEHG